MSVDHLQFYELSYNPQCSVCKLKKTNPFILKMIHDLRFNDNLGYQSIHKRIIPLLEHVGAKRMSWSAIARHFNNHVDFNNQLYREEIKLINTYTVLTDKRMNFDEKALRTLYYEGSSVGREDVDYKEMWNLFTKVASRVEAINADPNAFRTEAGKINFNALGSWASLVNQCRNKIGRASCRERV